VVEYLEWAATVVFVGSYFCRRVEVLRRVQMLGALMWVVYGVLIGAAGAYGNVLKVRPPLCFSRDNADLFLETLDAVLCDR